MKSRIKQTFLFLFALSSLASCSSSSTNESSSIPKESSSEAEKNLINYLGRYHFEKVGESGIPIFSYSGSGFEIKVNVQSENYRFVIKLYNRLSGQSSQFVNLYVDEALNRKIELKAEYETIEIASLTAGNHLIRINKLNEAQFSKIGLAGYEQSGAEIVEIEKRSKRKMEVYGDSITCGYGNLASSYKEEFSMATEDAMQTYGILCAEELGFDCNLVSCSGLAMALSPFGSEITLKDIYASSDMEKAWDLSYYVPEYVLINIGTNDNTAYLSSASSEKEAKLALFKGNYLSMMKSLKEAYGEQTKFICLANMMVSLHKDVNNAILDVISSFNEAYENSAFYCTFDPDGKGAVSHPGLEAHQRNAEILAELITSLDEML